jgi:hypothetical protein
MDLGQHVRPRKTEGKEGERMIGKDACPSPWLNDKKRKEGRVGGREQKVR